MKVQFIVQTEFDPSMTRSNEPIRRVFGSYRTQSHPCTAGCCHAASWWLIAPDVMMFSVAFEGYLGDVDCGTFFYIPKLPTIQKYENLGAKHPQEPLKDHICISPNTNGPRERRRKSEGYRQYRGCAEPKNHDKTAAVSVGYQTPGARGEQSAKHERGGKQTRVVPWKMHVEICTSTYRLEGFVSIHMCRTCALVPATQGTYSLRLSCICEKPVIFGPFSPNIVSGLVKNRSGIQEAHSVEVGTRNRERLRGIHLSGRFPT